MKTLKSMALMTLETQYEFLIYFFPFSLSPIYSIFQKFLSFLSFHFTKVRRDEKFHVKMTKAASIMNLKKHIGGFQNPVEISSAVDVEGHLGLGKREGVKGRMNERVWCCLLFCCCCCC
jgi:hypothetical protein